MLRESVLINAKIDESGLQKWRGNSVGAASFNEVAQGVIGLDRRALSRVAIHRRSQRRSRCRHGGRIERDPFGRPTSSNGTVDQSGVRIPDENTLQKSRQILDELRRRAGERSRPLIELDYIERLLKRF